MDVPKAIDLFKHEMNNEIFHSSADEDLQNCLLDAVKRVEKIVISTYEAEQKHKQ